MNILMLTPYLPYPIWSGGQIRSYNLLKNLSKKHTITLFSFIREEKERDYIQKLKEYCKDVQVFHKRPPWSPSSLTLAAFTYYPLVVCMYLNRQVGRAIENAIEKEHFDLIHSETFYVMPNIPSWKIPTILVEQTIEYLVYRHYVQHVGNPVKKAFMNWDVAKIHFWEKAYWQKAKRVVAMSEADRTVMRRHAPSLPVDLVPNGVDLEYFKPKEITSRGKKKTILFVGNFKWLQNREAVQILLYDILPRIRQQIPDVNVWIVGRFPSIEIRKLQNSRIRISENIEDIRTAYEQSDVMLAPIYGPGGTRYKILESMAVGLPVVTTSTGIEGLGAVSKSEALVCDSPDELAKGTVRLLTDNALYGTLSRNGRKLIEKHFDWKSIAHKLDAIYEEAAHGK